MTHCATVCVIVIFVGAEKGLKNHDANQTYPQGV